MNKESIHIIADYYGYESQSRQLIEEMAELTVAINKYQRGFKKFFSHINPPLETMFFTIDEIFNVIEEIADVEIMLEQIKYFTNSDVLVKVYKERKIKRQLERIEKEKTEKEKELL